MDENLAVDFFGFHFTVPQHKAIKGEKLEVESGEKKFTIRFSKDGEATGQIEGLDPKKKTKELFYLKKGKTIQGIKTNINFEG